MRTATPEAGYVNNTTYAMGGVNYAVNDRYPRLLLTSIIQQRNWSAAMRTNRTARYLQQGASLMVTLVMLAVLMVAGVTAYVASNTQFRMAANLQFQNIALNSAESALAAAETWVIANHDHTAFTVAGTAGLYPPGAAPDALNMTWDDTNSVKADLLGSQRYMIERIFDIAEVAHGGESSAACLDYSAPASCTLVRLFRLTSRGTSILGTTKIVQSVFTVKID